MQNVFSRIGAARLAIALLASVLVVWVFVASGGPKRCEVEFDQAGGVVCPGDTPGMIDVDVRLDDTMPRGNAELAGAASRRVVAYADVAIDSGGSLSISTFSRSAARGRTLLQLEIPGLEELRLSKRAGAEKKARDQVTKALAGWTASVTSEHASDWTSERGNGSDILGALVQPGAGPRTEGAPLVRLAITDGRVYVPGFSLVTVLRESPTKALQALRQRVPRVAADRRPDGLAIFGIGGTGGLVEDEDPALTEALTQTYRRLCPELAAACHSTPRL